MRFRFARAYNSIQFCLRERGNSPGKTIKKIEMKKIAGLLLCMGILLVGQIAYASPPGDVEQYETTVGISDTPAVEAGYTVNIEVLTLVSHWAAAQATLDLRAEISRVTDTTPFDSMIAGLRANAANREIVARLIDEMTVHRWRDYSNRYAGVPIDMIYRPGWKRKVCEG